MLLKDRMNDPPELPDSMSKGKNWKRLISSFDDCLSHDGASFFSSESAPPPRLMNEGLQNST